MSESIKYYQFRVDFTDGFLLLGKPDPVPDKIIYNVEGVPKYKYGTIIPIPDSLWENIDLVANDDTIPEEDKPAKVFFNKTEMLSRYIKEVPNPNAVIASQVEATSLAVEEDLAPLLKKSRKKSASKVNSNSSDVKV